MHGSNGTSEKEVQGAFHSTKTSGLNFRQLLVANRTAFSKFSKKEDNLARYTQIFENFSRKFSFRSTLFPEFLEFSCEWFAFRKFTSFRNFWKLFREVSVPFAAVPKFSKVLVDTKAPKLPVGIFRTEILVPFLRRLFFKISFRFLQPFCANGKRDSGTKFTSPELCEPFTQTVNRPVRPRKW